MENRIDTSKTCSGPRGEVPECYGHLQSNLQRVSVPCVFLSKSRRESLHQVYEYMRTEAGKVAERHHILVPQEHHEVSIRPLFWAK